jgi:hypothetical protein
MPNGVHGRIHEFSPDPVTGAVDYDEEGDPRLGFYFDIADGQGNALSMLMGPYGSKEQAEAACTLAWERRDY